MADLMPAKPQPKLPDQFSQLLIAWQRRQGRHDLPWQNTRDPYVIWLSEIMLQQTQVTAVIPYFKRFLSRFPTVASLAAASVDEVLALWSGLGYYSRARHLHRAAQQVMLVYGGAMPKELDALIGLPGIGRSTAAAIAVFAFGQRAAILDGNVKRVLARVCGIAGYPGESAVAAELWSMAEALLPKRHLESYTQGLMDLGATLCKRRKPLCESCPMHSVCVALQTDRVAELPTPKPHQNIPLRRTQMLMLYRDAEVLLERRPDVGIWGGLWSFPEIALEMNAVDWCLQRYQAQVSSDLALPTLNHGFTHFKLAIVPQPLRVRRWPLVVADDAHAWFSLDRALGAGIPQPVRLLLEQWQRSRP